EAGGAGVLDGLETGGSGGEDFDAEETDGRGAGPEAEPPGYGDGPAGNGGGHEANGGPKPAIEPPEPEPPPVRAEPPGPAKPAPPPTRYLQAQIRRHQGDTPKLVRGPLDRLTTYLLDVHVGPPRRNWQRGEIP